MPSSRVCFLLASSALAVAGCTTLATSPAYVGGGLADSAPARTSAAEARLAEESARIASQPKSIGAKHILVMHGKSQRKPESVTRSRDEARLRAEECLRKIRGGAEFEAMVREYSDEPGAADRGGDLGTFQRGAMVKLFADAAFALKVGEVSEVVETPFGFHVILRTE
jgi:parvulin-like peptidyl-prolyl isomerase